MTLEPQRTIPAVDDAPPASSCAAEPASGPGRAPSGPCNCLPAAQDGWVACAQCGLPQAPGKAFCSFCGSRWPAEPGA
jgi:hypothetical protein